MSAVFIDLDRTLLRRASGRALNDGLVEAGVIPPGRSLPGDKILYAINDRFGENLFAMGLARAAARVARGWRQEDVIKAGEFAIDDLVELVAPFAPGIMATFRQMGFRLVLSTTTPMDMIEPFADALGFDAVIATRYEVKNGKYTGRLEDGFVWGLGKLQAVRRWAEAEGVDLDECHACSDSIFDTPLLSSVGWPHAVNPDPSLFALATARRWPIEYWDRPGGVPSLVGWEPYHVLRPFVRPESFPYAALRHCRARQGAGQGPGAPGGEPPQLLRRGAPGHRGRTDRAPGALPGQARGVRRARRRLDRPGHRRHPGRPGQWVPRTTARGGSGAARG